MRELRPRTGSWIAGKRTLKLQSGAYPTPTDAAEAMLELKRHLDARFEKIEEMISKVFVCARGVGDAQLDCFT